MAVGVGAFLHSRNSLCKGSDLWTVFDMSLCQSRVTCSSKTDLQQTSEMVSGLTHRETIAKSRRKMVEYSYSTYATFRWQWRKE